MPNWDQTNNPFKQLVIPSDGWLVINLHAENTPQSPVDSNDFLQTRLNVYINGLLMCEADASTGGYKTHVESSDTNTVPVKTGDVIRYGSSGICGPNGRYNYIRLFLAPFVN